ncbi:cysteine hydrolase family protein [Flexivirga meconopsidis]|uniref:cysteine hydrolase family protein n=1 Tax=Flexivirga meconopsidis TaxID=2977121 RepID=UPI00223F4EA6|nr:cysteine hydrolase family protein [Flexivirga meconopsidis]
MSRWSGLAAFAAAGTLALGLSACGAAGSTAQPKAPATSTTAGKNLAKDTTTLRELNKLPESPATLADATLVLVDYQNVYTSGAMKLDGWRPAVDNAKQLLDRARAARTPVIHIVDKGYDLKSAQGQIIPALKPRAGEQVVVKSVPDAFRGTRLLADLKKTGRTKVIVAGFMTHMCTLFTTQGAFVNGFAPTVIGDASATRALPLSGDPNGIPADAVQRTALATVQDLYGVVVPAQRDLS